MCPCVAWHSESEEGSAEMRERMQVEDKKDTKSKTKQNSQFIGIEKKISKRFGQVRSEERRVRERVCMFV